MEYGYNIQDMQEMDFSTAFSNPDEITNRILFSDFDLAEFNHQELVKAGVFGSAGNSYREGALWVYLS